MANTNSFRAVANKYQGSPIVILIFAFSLAMLIFGVNNFAEDVYSSYLGIQEIEVAYNLNVQIWSFTYWVMSASFQVTTIVFFFMFMSTGDKKFMWGSFAAQFVDFFADAWYRSNGTLFDSPSSAVMSSGFTFVFFTVGSEVFVTIGIGLVLALFAPTIREFKYIVNDTDKAIKGGGGGGGDRGDRSDKGSRPQSRPESRPMSKPGQSAAQAKGSARRQELEQQFHPVGASGNNGSEPPPYLKNFLDELNNKDKNNE